jgi:uncharacterized protein YecE (DUF72 family)
LNNVHIGTSGYSYKDWVGRFYPKGTKTEDFLSYYATRLNTVELNVTFYRTPNTKTFEGWYGKTPPDFHFVIKGSRFITHIKRLNDCEEAVRRFLDAAAPLKEKLKVILWQLPPKFPADTVQLLQFLIILSSAMAKKRINFTDKTVRHAFEFRDKSWLTEQAYSLLRQHKAALVFSDHPFDITEPVTTDFLYIRRHGPGGAYHEAYPDRDLHKDANLIRRFNLPAYEFFNNDVQAVGADNAVTLQTILATI